MSTFLVLYRGETIPQAKMVAVSAEPALVAEFVARLLRHDEFVHPIEADPVLREVEGGRRQALRLLARESEEADDGN